MLAEPHRLSEQQWQVVLGSLMGDGNLSPNRRDRSRARFRWGTAPSRSATSTGRSSLLGNIEPVRGRRTPRVPCSSTSLRCRSWPSCARPSTSATGRSTSREDYLKALTPLALAIWYMDDGGFTVRSKGVQERTRGGSGRIEICVEAMSRGFSGSGSPSYLRDTYGLDVTARLAWRAAEARAGVLDRSDGEVPGARSRPTCTRRWSTSCCRGSAVSSRCEPEFVDPTPRLVPARVLDIQVEAARPGRCIASTSRWRATTTTSSTA